MGYRYRSDPPGNGDRLLRLRPFDPLTDQVGKLREIV
jgi:hypothetical protein